MDHDRLFKELLTNFFREFIDLFLPDVAQYIEPGPLEFLDKEVFTDEKHGLPVFPVALLSYDKPARKEPHRYQVGFPGHRVLDFNFRTVQLNRLNWRDYLRNPNPVTSALMTKMKIAPKDRPRVKLECLRMLITLKLDPARAVLISSFMNSYLKLTPAETVVYNREVETIEPKEREVVMEWTNEWIEQGKAEGVLVGELRGRREGQSQVLIRLLRRRLGPATDILEGAISKLSSEQLDELADALFDFSSFSDAQRWLAQRA